VSRVSIKTSWFSFIVFKNCQVLNERFHHMAKTEWHDTDNVKCYCWHKCHVKNLYLVSVFIILSHLSHNLFIFLNFNNFISFQIEIKFKFYINVIMIFLLKLIFLTRLNLFKFLFYIEFFFLILNKNIYLLFYKIVLKCYI